MSAKKNVVYFWDPEVGNFHYGKPACIIYHKFYF